MMQIDDNASCIEKPSFCTYLVKMKRTSFRAANRKRGTAEF